MKRSSLITLLVATTMLVGCAVKSTTGGTTPGEASSGFMGLSKTDDITVETGAAFKDKSQVVIGSFQVTFLEEKRASNKAGGGLLGNGFGGKSTAKLDLVGVTPAYMQAITEAVYQDFLGKLASSGYSVADRGALVAHPDFTGVSADVSPKREESSFFGGDVTQTTVAPQAIGKIYGGGFGFSNPSMGAALFAEKANTPVLFVNYTVDFANMAGGHGGYFKTTSSVEVGQGISVPPGSGVTIIGGQSGTFSTTVGSVKLGQPVFSTTTFGEVVNTTTDTEAGVETAMNVIGVLGGIGSNQTRSFEVRANPDSYAQVSANVMGDANTKLIGKMVALR